MRRLAKSDGSPSADKACTVDRDYVCSRRHGDAVSFRYTRRRVLRAGPLAVVLILLTCGHGGAQVNDECYEQLVEHGASGWRAINARIADLDVQMKSVQLIEIPSEKIRNTNERNYTACWQLGKQRHRVHARYYQDGSPVSGEELFIGNPRYRFTVSTVRGSDAFALVEATRRKRDLPFLTEAERMFKSMLFCSTCIWGISLAEIIGNEEFVVVECRRSEQSSGTVRVAWEFRGDPLPGRYYRDAKYWAELDENLDWCVVKCGVDVNHSAILDYVASLSYGDQFANGVVFPDSFASTLRETDDVSVKLNARFTVAKKSYSDEEFYLPHYGISESAAGVKGPWWHLLVWIVPIGLTAAAVALGLLHWSRRMR